MREAGQAGGTGHVRGYRTGHDLGQARGPRTGAVACPLRKQSHLPEIKHAIARICRIPGKPGLRYRARCAGKSNSPSSVESGPTLDRSETKGCEGFAWNRTNTSVIASPRGRTRLSRGCGGGARIIRESRTPPSRVLPPRSESTPARRPGSAVQRKWAAPKKGRTARK